MVRKGGRYREGLRSLAGMAESVPFSSADVNNKSGYGTVGSLNNTRSPRSSAEYERPSPTLLSEDEISVHSEGGGDLNEMDPEGSTPQSRQAKPSECVFNLANAAIGAGVLAFPFAFKCSGLLLGQILTVGLVLVMLYTLRVLISYSDRFQSTSYQALVREGLGGRMGTVVTFTLLLYLYGACIAMLIIIGDTMTPAFSSWIGSDSIFSNRKFLIALFSCFFCYPLSMLRSLKSLAFASSAAVLSLGYLGTVVLIEGIQQLKVPNWSDGIREWPNSAWPDLILTLPKVVFAFQCHIQAVPVFDELRNPRTVAKGRTMRTQRMHVMGMIMSWALCICYVLYSLVGSFGYITFLDDTQSDVLNNYSASDTKINIGRLAVALTAIVSYPINHFPARIALNELVYMFQGAKDDSKKASSYKRHTLLTLSFFLAALLPALFVEDLGTVFDLIGATAGVMVIFLIPAALLWTDSVPEHTLAMHQGKPAGSQKRLLRMPQSKREWIGFLIFTLGMAIFVLTMLVTFIYSSDKCSAPKTTYASYDEL